MRLRGEQVDADHDQSIAASMKVFAVEHALPLWALRGWDAQCGGFFEQLGADGEPDRMTPRRIRVQARQIYCFAKAAFLGWYPEGRDLALRGLEYLLAKAKGPDGKPGFISLLSPDGSGISAERNTYDHAFILLALATVFRLNQDSQLRVEIDYVLQFLDESLKSKHGGYLEGIPTSLPRRQNPHMHLFEAMIALFDATLEARFQARAGELFSLFVAHFYDPRTKVLGEYFEEDWSKILPVSVEPGHQAEWVWLLKAFERISGCPTSSYRSELLNSALRYRDARTGCLVDEGGVDGRIIKSSGRCWPQTEIAKAWMAQFESGEAGAAREARAALRRLDRYYLRHPIRGGWYDSFHHDNEVKGAPIIASSFYHILCAIAEADRLLS